MDVEVNKAIENVIWGISKDNLGFAILCLSGFAGMFVHWAKKWVRDETDTGLYQYLFQIKKKSTALSMLTYFSVIATMLAAGSVDYWSSQTLSIAFLAGYMIDSAINKDVEQH